ncbi:hypothetical protein EAO70_12980 [Streptomyces sp. adm13(2018)]|uniref:hypothetical protein n=1 Tax=Streptomyces sp. adm13(2018) TaxID=2479007 RepID=UPI0011CE2EC1|nr:hypothetical protein [Streptomyces sp. adm13(2018)]TXS16346.1 hypothetical protein EAO70_12980 [Streptomyces sp. adm13(2018)]
MKTTETYGFPYPECDPPKVKDSSQISQLRALAVAVDEEVERVVNVAERDLIHPAAARFAIATLPVVASGTLESPVFDTTVYSINWGPSPALVPVTGGVRISTPGWYLIGCHALVTSATAAVLPMVRITLNGSPASSWSAVAGNYGVGNGRLASLSAVPLSLVEGDIIRMEIQHVAAGTPVWDYRPHLWAVRLVDA